MEKVAIVIVNYQTPWHLDKCLEYLFKFTKDFKVYLVQNKPDAESLAVGEKWESAHPEQVMIYHNQKNLGFVGGVNTAYAEAVQHEFICMLNSDVLVTGGWLDELVAAFDDKAVMQVAPDCNQYYEETFLWKLAKQFVGRFSKQLWYQLYEWRYSLNPPRAAEPKGFSEYPYFFQFAGGFCTVFRSGPIKERGYILDPNIVHGYWDDNELSMYMQQFGKVGRVDNSYVFHFLNVSFDKVDELKHDLKKELQQLNGFYVIEKWQDFILQKLSEYPESKVAEFARNTHEVDKYLQYFGLKQIHNKNDYLQRAKEIGEKFLN